MDFKHIFEKCNNLGMEIYRGQTEYRNIKLMEKVNFNFDRPSAYKHIDYGWENYIRMISEFHV